MATLWMSPDAIAAAAIKTGVPSFWFDRIRDMARHSSIVRGTAHGDNDTLPLSLAAVDPQWPLKGAILIERKDGYKFKFYLRGKVFKVDTIKKRTASTVKVVQRYLAAANRIDISKWERSNIGFGPKGFGNWGFEFGGSLYKDTDNPMFFRGTYGDAKKQALQFAREMKYTDTIYLMP